jgi:hypothetical protein
MCNILSERTEAFCQLVDKGMTGPPKLRRAFWLECRACGEHYDHGEFRTNALEERR